jgi:tRNA A37 methylthiotransferase MiaB
VFSQFSQPVALLLIEKIRTVYPNKIILVGGVGSQKPTDPSVVKPFGQMLLENKLIDSWQSDISVSEIERVLPQQLTLGPVKDVDFSIYELESYDWSETSKSVPVLGSHGCVRQCSFCDVIKHFSSYSFIEADQLTKQIVQIFQQTGVAKFIFMDSLVNGSMSNFLTEKS